MSLDIPASVFFTRKVHRRIGGNFTFLILTDRDDLDTQIYSTFASCRVALNRLRWQIAELRASLDKMAAANAAMARKLNLSVNGTLRGLSVPQPFADLMMLGSFTGSSCLPNPPPWESTSDFQLLKQQLDRRCAYHDPRCQVGQQINLSWRKLGI